MYLRPPRTTLTDTLCPYTTLFLSPLRQAARPAAAPLRRQRACARLRGGGARSQLGSPRTFHVRLRRRAQGRGAESRQPTGQLPPTRRPHRLQRSEEHTSELQSLMRISYAVFCLIKKNNNTYQ